MYGRWFPLVLCLWPEVLRSALSVPTFQTKDWRYYLPSTAQELANLPDGVRGLGWENKPRTNAGGEDDPVLFQPNAARFEIDAGSSVGWTAPNGSVAGFAFDRPIHWVVIKGNVTFAQNDGS